MVFKKKKAGALSETHGKSRMYTLTDRLPTYWIYLVFMNISYSLFTNEIAKLFDSEFENEDHVINMPWVGIKIYGTDEMFFTIDNDVKEPCNLNRAWIIQENKKISANWPTIILKVYTSICKTVCGISMMLKKISTQTAREITSLFTDYGKNSRNAI